MAAPNTPTNVYVTQANGQVNLQWDLTSTATSYSVQRSTDGVSYTTLASPTTNYYLDDTVSLSTRYYYQVAAVNMDGTSAYSTAQMVIPTPTAEMSLYQLRLAAQQRADRVNSNFVTLPEWNSYLNQAMYELYDLLIDTYEDYFIATPLQFVSVNNQYMYPLPDGKTSYTNGITGQSGYIAPPFYKVVGFDLGLNTATNAYVTMNRFNMVDRNNFLYPNTSSTIYGVFNLQYRVLGNQIMFTPTPSAGQPIRMWYIPRLTELLQDTDTTSVGISGWTEYIIVRAALLALTKEESDTSGLVLQLQALTKRIEESAVNRDAGMPDRISDVRRNGMGNRFGDTTGWGSPWGGM